MFRLTARKTPLAISVPAGTRTWAAVKATLVLWSVLGGHENGTTPFSAVRKALNQAHREQKERGSRAHLFMSGQ
jgi:hypothetical protein